MVKEIRVATVWFNREFAESLIENGISVPIVLGNNHAAGNLKNKIEQKGGRLFLRIHELVLEDEREVLGIPNSVMPLDEKRRMYKKYGKQFRMNFTRQFASSIRSFDGWMNVEHHFHNQIDLFYQLLKNYNIDTVVCRNFPHLGAEVLIVAAAESLGLRLIISHQSQMPGRFWAMGAIEDFGIFQTVTLDDPTYDPTIPPPTKPFYMKQSFWQRSKLKTILSLANQFLHVLLRSILILPLFKAKFWKGRIHGIHRKLSRLESTDPSRYIKSLKIDFPDLSGVKYVYFPLHFQPELTTEVLGGDYADQLLAIEELASKLGPSIMIIVKENPKQTGYMRGREFYKRLGRIPNVRYVDVSVSTFDLTQKSIGVATISGTVGWEALRMKKPVILFGVSWYRSLPGVVQINDKDLVAKLLGHTFDDDKLKAAYKKVVQKSLPGLVDPKYSPIIPDYNETQMYLRTVESFTQLIKSNMG